MLNDTSRTVTANRVVRSLGMAAFLITLFTRATSPYGGSVTRAAAEPAPSAPDQNWAQWRGPLAAGVAPAGDPPTEWSETKNIKWNVKIPGSGTATPIIWEKKIFIQTAINTGKSGNP